MKTIVFVILLFACVLPSLAQADLDLDQEVLVIPDTHNAKPYIWHVRQDPQGCELVFKHMRPAGQANQFLVGITDGSGEVIGEMHVFITDDDLQTYTHVRPAKDSDGRYSFNFAPPAAGMYRFEIVFRTDKGWVNLRKDVTLEKSAVKETDTSPGDEDYDAKVKFYPRKIYVDHVGTFLYQLSYRDKPLADIEKIDGADMQVGTWSEDLKEFIYMTPQQNLGGPEVGVSMVFKRPGRHAVFAEFKHKGVIRRVDFVVTIYAEPPQIQGTLPALGTAE